MTPLDTKPIAPARAPAPTEHAVGVLLETLPHGKRTGARAVSFTARNGHDVTGIARAYDELATIEVSLGEPVAGTAELALLSGGCGPFTKIVQRASGHPRVTSLATELPLADGVSIEAGVRAFLASFAIVAGHARGERARPSEPDGEARASLVELAEACAEAGWEARTRDGAASERLAVELETPGRFHRAHVGPLADATTLVSAELDPLEAQAPAVTRRAVSAFLLEVAGAVRLVRGTLTPEGPDLVPRFEVLLGSVATAALLDRALGALSTACARHAAVLDELRDPHIARSYLLLRGLPAS